MEAKFVKKTGHPCIRFFLVFFTLFFLFKAVEMCNYGSANGLNEAVSLGRLYTWIPLVML